MIKPRTMNWVALAALLLGCGPSCPEVKAALDTTAAITGDVTRVNELVARRKAAMAEAGQGGHGTFHMSSADAEGNLASVTLSHGGGFGSKFIVPGLGLVLGHGMCRFDPRPGLPNSVAGGKRPLNNTCPLLLALPDRCVAVGLPGGRRLISVASQFAQRIVDFGASGREAIASPRLHVGIREPVYLSEDFPRQIARELQCLGHTLERRKVAGDAHCVELLAGGKQVRAAGNAWAAGAG